MGYLENRRRKKEERARASALARWTAQDRTMQEFLSELKMAPSRDIDGFLLKKGEAGVLNYNGAFLIEPRRQPGQYRGGYSGFSFKIADGVRYHVGGSRGTYVPGPEVASVIDRGTVTMTSQRVVFRGPKQTREWAFPKLLGWTRDSEQPLTYLQVSNRQKTTGFGYAPNDAPIVRFRLAWAMALFSDQVDDLARTVEQEWQEHQKSRPVPVLGPGGPRI
jgi:hypothetical protein